MLDPLHIAPFALAILFILHRIAKSIINGRQFRQSAASSGCEEPADLTEPFPYGFRMLWRIMQLDKTGEDLLDDVMTEEFGDKTTFKKTTHDGTTLIQTIEPVNVQTLLALKFNDYETGSRRRKILYPVVGDSIFSSDGAFWQHSRALFRPQFSRDNINDLDATDRSCNHLINVMGEVDESGWTNGVALQPLLYNFTMDTASHFLFGESLHAQPSSLDANADPEAIARSRIFTQAFDQIGLTSADRFRLQGLYFLADGPKFRKALADVKAVTDHFVKRAIKEATEDDTKQDHKYSLLTALARETKDETELRNQILAILFAGRDTTASLLGWCFTRLALHPDILSALRSATLRHFENGEISFASLKACRPLQNFINEVLRLHPTVPINGRFATTNTILPTGGGPSGTSPVAVRKGQFVLFSVYLMHRRKDLWSEDALEFRPERFENKIPSWQFLPFIGGPRICLGQQFAITEVGYLLVRMLRAFDRIEPVNEGEMRRMKKTLGLTVTAAEGVRVRLHRSK
ncbi:cytochrome P450 monooxygenase CYP52G11 [Teratosphaeria nubilosa]|uniref:Cytochrome P450 monooxygenase CYP52G11 n=1 Tax=Teratosphaeria nubilosa TaxID=161662 RepID=A0A6G1LL00_9PEZI|nr:cytochrome P450 monooxygenase CYP52G11 [Teratosphaeria nubilosa]